jgi:hypothetical protein
MRRDFRAGNMRTALKRLETLVGKGQRHCPWCLLNYRHYWPDARLPRSSPDELTRYRCEICGTEILFDFSNYPGEERELMRLKFSFTMEDIYTKPAASALTIWLLIHPSRSKLTEPKKMAAKKDAPLDHGARALAKLRSEEEKVIGGKRKRFQARHGDPTAWISKMIHFVKAGVHERWQAHYGGPGLAALANEQSVYLICAELEKVIWGSVRPDTFSALRRLEESLLRVVEEARAQRDSEGVRLSRAREQEEEEKRQRASEEEAARLRREAEERERRAKPKWGEPKPVNHMKGMHVFDFTEYEREIASGRHPSGQVPSHLSER